MGPNKSFYVTSEGELARITLVNWEFIIWNAPDFKYIPAFPFITAFNNEFDVITDIHIHEKRTVKSKLLKAISIFVDFGHICIQKYILHKACLIKFEN